MHPEELPHPQADPTKTPAEIDLYEVAEFIYAAKVEYLKEIGELRRPAEITSEEELDDHFDELARVYRQVCLELGLTWPPPPINVDEGSERGGWYNGFQ